MLPDTVNNEIEVSGSTTPVNTNRGLHLATTGVQIIGSVHASGEAHLTVNEVYGDLDDE